MATEEVGKSESKPKKDMPGPRKAAIFLLSLGSAQASQVLKHFDNEEVERITMEIANTSYVESDEVESVGEEFMTLYEARRFLIEGGMDSAKDVLEKAFGPQKASDIMKKLRESSQVKPFTFVRQAEPQQVVSLINQEHPQTIALILSHLDSDQASAILSNLSPEVQADISRRIATMERTSPEILKGVEKVLRDRLATVFQQDFTFTGGIPTIVNILNRVDRGTEKHILEELEKEDAELAEEIRQQMFIFEDITSLDNASIQRVIREIESKDLALALKGSSEEVQERIMRNLSKRAATMLKEEMEYMGPVRLSEVEDAQQKVVNMIRQLDESGEIIISRGGDDAIVT